VAAGPADTSAESILVLPPDEGSKRGGTESAVKDVNKRTNCSYFYPSFWIGAILLVEVAHKNNFMVVLLEISNKGE
jgi:hypothetical protein